MSVQGPLADIGVAHNLVRLVPIPADVEMLDEKRGPVLAPIPLFRAAAASACADSCRSQLRARNAAGNWFGVPSFPTTPDRLLDVYDLARAGAKAVMREAMQQVGDVPEVVAETVLKAATAAAPRRRYAAGKKARQTSFLRRFVPEAAFDKSLRKQMRLPL